MAQDAFEEHERYLAAAGVCGNLKSTALKTSVQAGFATVGNQKVMGGNTIAQQSRSCTRPPSSDPTAAPLKGY